MGVKRRPSRRPGGQRTSGSSATATKAVLIGYERWYARHLQAGEPDHLTVAESSALLSELFDRSAGRLHVPTAAVLEELLAVVDDDPALSPRLPEVIETLEHYLDFAVETGGWPAGDDEIDESSEVLEVAYELSTQLLDFLLDSVAAVEEVPAAVQRAAFESLPSAIRTPAELLERLRIVLGDAHSTVPAELALERVVGLLCVGLDPRLLPDRTEERILAMLDTAAGVTAAEARTADAPTRSMLDALERDGLLRPVETDGVVRRETPFGLRPALADALTEVADELGLLSDDEMNPHPAGTALLLNVAVLGTKPAQWRRLVLAADADLGELHLATQLAFDWADDEPHAFTLAEEPSTVITSIDPEGGTPEEVVDETEVQLGELFAEVGDEVRYRYGTSGAAAGDAGAEQLELVIRFESVATAEQRTLPRCV